MTQTEHGFVSLISLSDGRMGTVWLDGRNMKDMKETEEHAPAPESMSLRYAAIDRDGKLSMKLSSITVCASCQTSAAVTSEGPLPCIVIALSVGIISAVGTRLITCYIYVTPKLLMVNLGRPRWKSGF